MIDSLVDMNDVISGDSRQRIDAKVLISGFTGIFNSILKESMNICLEIPDNKYL